MLLLRDRVLLAALALSLCLLAAAGWIIAAPQSPPSAETAAPLGLSGIGSSAASATATASGSLVVDVEGAVARPGIIELPVGSRVADALRAAGGYTDATDLAAAAAGLNLAAPLTDGTQILVPVKGAAPAGGGSASGGGGGPGGLVNLNTATPEELDALPGIGPVTVQKIVAARTERPFASLEEAVERDALDNGQLEKIRDLATV
jgi:competence protein ComEA